MTLHVTTDKEIRKKEVNIVIKKGKKKYLQQRKITANEKNKHLYLLLFMSISFLRKIRAKCCTLREKLNKP